MSKRAEQAANEIYKDGIELFGRRDRNGNLIIHPETMMGILRNACQRGYEQAEKDLTLTWEDIKNIDNIVVDMARNTDWPLRGQEVFYTEVLQRFAKLKEEKKK